VSQQLTNDPIGRAVLESLAWLLLCLDEADDDEVDRHTFALPPKLIVPSACIR
jgi:hypothetical protein